MKFIGKFAEKYDKIEKVILIAMFAVLVAVIFMQVVSRYVFHNAISWSEELGRFIFVWMSWLGVSAGMKEGEHIQVKILPNYFKEKGWVNAERGLYIFIDLIWFLTSLVVVYYGFDIVGQQMAMGVFAVATKIPMWIIYLCIPICSIIVCLRLVGQMVNNAIAIVKDKSKKKGVDA